MQMTTNFTFGFATSRRAIRSSNASGWLSGSHKYLSLPPADITGLEGEKRPTKSGHTTTQTNRIRSTVIQIRASRALRDSEADTRSGIQVLVLIHGNMKPTP